MAPSKSSSADGEKQDGTIFSISGPVIVAENMIGCAMYELVREPITVVRWETKCSYCAV
jgi:V-type H+-transporting ATPase subunit A